MIGTKSGDHILCGRGGSPHQQTGCLLVNIDVCQSLMLLDQSVIDGCRRCHVTVFGISELQAMATKVSQASRGLYGCRFDPSSVRMSASAQLAIHIMILQSE